MRQGGFSPHGRHFYFGEIVIANLSLYHGLLVPKETVISGASLTIHS